jgi:hypothetical protein
VDEFLRSFQVLGERVELSCPQEAVDFASKKILSTLYYRFIPREPFVGDYKGLSCFLLLSVVTWEDRF